MLCLKSSTDPVWARHAIADLDALLVDHAHCEMKAASNALALAARHSPRMALVKALSDLAREEVDHFQRVLALVEARGLVLGPPPVDSYAADLRRAASALPRHETLSPLVDRLLVGALIEARSCERFKLVLEALGEVESVEPSGRPGGLAAVRALYKDLFPAEARHYRTFLDLALAEAVGSEDAVHARLDSLAESEARIVGALSLGVERAMVHG